jgi:RNA polymerase sigma-70 factor (ECF subfamily)
MSPQASTAPGVSPSCPRTSWRLLARARLGDVGALGQLVSRCLPDLRRWAHGRLPRWARTAADTPDLIQDAVLGTLRRLDTCELRGRDALAAYLREAVRNRIRDEHRRVARRGTSRAPSELVADPGPSPLDCTLLADRERGYREALARLRPSDRELIVAHVELGYSHAQLGCMTGRTGHAARMALGRAVRRLTELMRHA